MCINLADHSWLLFNIQMTLIIVEISQNVTVPFTTTCDLKSFAIRFENIYNYKTNFELTMMQLLKISSH